MENKKVFLTGGRGDIGSAIKKVFEEHGYSVTAPNSQELNLKNKDEIEKYFSNKENSFDVIVHCAGINNPDTIDNLTYENVETTAKINYMSFFEIVKILSPKMSNGKIVAISSLYGTISRKGRLAYTASKAALEGCVKTLCCELADKNILVNAVSPGFVDTKLTSKNNTKEKIKQLEGKIPLKRLAKTEEIANVVYFLCSEQNTYISGQNIVVDGGLLAEGGQGSWE